MTQEERTRNAAKLLLVSQVLLFVGVWWLAGFGWAVLSVAAWTLVGFAAHMTVLILRVDETPRPD